MQLRNPIAIAVLGLAALSTAAIGCASQDMQKLTSDVNQLAESTGKKVTLTANELDLLGEIFGKTLNVRRLKVVADSPVAKGASRTIENTIYLDPKLNPNNAAYRSSSAFLKLLAHEATHVWQFQNEGLGYIPDALWQQGVGVAVHGDRNTAYEFDVRDSKDFSKLNSEQQAELIESYVANHIFAEKPIRAKGFDELGSDSWRTKVESLIQGRLNRDFKSLDRNAWRQRIGVKATKSAK